VNIMTKRKKRHSPEQIVRKIQQADRIPASAGTSLRCCVSSTSRRRRNYRWRNHYGGLKAEDAKKLKALEKQNLQLKKLLAEAELEKAVLKELAERVV